MADGSASAQDPRLVVAFATSHPAMHTFVPQEQVSVRTTTSNEEADTDANGPTCWEKSEASRFAPTVDDGLGPSIVGTLYPIILKTRSNGTHPPCVCPCHTESPSRKKGNAGTVLGEGPFPICCRNNLCHQGEKMLRRTTPYADGTVTRPDTKQSGQGKGKCSLILGKAVS